VTQWTGPLRTFFWYPVLVDYWLLPAVLAGLLIVERLRQGGRWAVWLPLLCPVSMLAVTVRESGLLIPLAALPGLLFWMRRRQARTAAPASSVS
jgi:hypothetical protein